jgi:hypothetical protein
MNTVEAEVLPTLDLQQPARCTVWLLNVLSKMALVAQLLLLQTRAAST